MTQEKCTKIVSTTTSRNHTTNVLSENRSIDLIEYYKFDWRASLYTLTYASHMLLYARALMPVYSTYVIYVYLRPRLHSVAHTVFLKLPILLYDKSVKFLNVAYSIHVRLEFFLAFPKLFSHKISYRRRVYRGRTINSERSPSRLNKLENGAVNTCAVTKRRVRI